MTGDINHDVDVQYGETIEGIREEIDYGKCFLCIKNCIGMFERGMEFNCPRRIDIGQQKFMDMESMTIVK